MQRKRLTPKDFTWTRWTTADIQALPETIFSEKKARLTLIKAIRREDRTFENTIYALHASDHGLTETIAKIDLLQNISPLPEIRATAQKAMGVIERQMIAIEHDPKIWHAIKEYYEHTGKKERASLRPEDQKLVEDTYRSYKRMGFDLPKETRKRVRALEQRLANVSNAFRQAINDSRDFILVPEKDMQGLPSRYLSGLTRDTKGNYIVTTAYPDYNPFMELSPHESYRHALSLKFLRRGGEKNIERLKEMIALRAEHARLLGYNTHADFKTELRMSKNARTAEIFVNDLLKKVTEGGRRDLAELLALKKELTGNPKAVLHTYDIGYYGHELQKRKFNIDGEAIRAYFPLFRVIEGTFKIYSTLFGVTFKKVSGVKLWHPDVTLYHIYDSRGAYRSSFALDLYPREGKYGHAAAFGIIPGRALSYRGESYQAPFATLVTNFPKGTRAKPSLLSHDEVETFLHEFGHIMHCTLTTARNVAQSGYHTVWDFVEAPSQMLEHWAWDPKSLRLLSTHHETGNPLPKKLLEGLLKSRDHLLRYGTLRQLIFAKFDLVLHTKNSKDPNTLYKKLLKEGAGLTAPKNSLFPAGFGHLDGYDAGYYGYMWSKVYAADMFTRFAREGILNKKTGMEYKRAILEQGGSRDELDLVRDFLKREPNNKAFLKEIGVA